MARSANHRLATFSTEQLAGEKEVRAAPVLRRGASTSLELLLYVLEQLDGYYGRHASRYRDVHVMVFADIFPVFQDAHEAIFIKRPAPCRPEAPGIELLADLHLFDSGRILLEDLAHDRRGRLVCLIVVVVTLFIS